MCFAAMPKVQPPTPPPTLRDATLDALGKKQTSAATTTKTDNGGDLSAANGYKSTLGG